MAQNVDLSNNLSANQFSKSQNASDSGINYPIPPPGQADAFFNAGLSQAQIESFVAQTQQKQAQQSTTLSQYGLDREPWIFTTFDSIATFAADTGGIGGAASGGYNTTASTIYWAASPKSVTWQVSQRASEDKNKSGTVLHVWRDRSRGTDYDDPKINIQFQSGSTLPILSPSGSQIAPGLNNFYQYLELVDRSKIAVNGEPNVIHILYRSPIFPSMVITGLFDPQMVVQFTDDSQNPWQVSNWSANFTIYSTIPKFRSFAELRSRFETPNGGPRLDGNFSVKDSSKVNTASSLTGNFATTNPSNPFSSIG